MEVLLRIRKCKTGRCRRNSTYERTNIDFNTSYKLGEKTTFKGKMSYSTSSSSEYNKVQIVDYF
jgi:hypothetical protein